MTPAASVEKPDLFERIAQALPAEQREDYWREIAYLKHLDADDELLRLTRATGYPRRHRRSVLLPSTSSNRWASLIARPGDLPIPTAALPNKRGAQSIRCAPPSRVPPIPQRAQSIT